MPLTESRGNMYEWVTHTHSHLRGTCPHECSYCYVKSTTAGRTGHYKGPLRLQERELSVPYGSGRTIFVEHMNDLFADDVPVAFIKRIMAHCRTWPESQYVFQSKNPERMLRLSALLPVLVYLGTTMETNREYPLIMGTAPCVFNRSRSMFEIANRGMRTFVTIEPVLDFDVEPFADMIASCRPFFVNLGADSKGHKLPEPPVEKIHALVDALKQRGVELRVKRNLDRLTSQTPCPSPT